MNDSATSPAAGTDERNRCSPVTQPTPIAVWANIGLHVVLAAVLFPSIFGACLAALAILLDGVPGMVEVWIFLMTVLTASAFAPVVSAVTCSLQLGLFAMIERTCEFRLPWTLLGACLAVGWAGQALQ